MGAESSARRRRRRRPGCLRGMFAGLWRVALVVAIVLTARRALRAPVGSARREHVRDEVERVAFAGAGGRRMVVVTAVNYAFRAYAVNLACSLERAGAAAGLVVVALDADMHRFSRARGWASVYLPARAARGDRGSDSESVFGSRGFNLLSKRKLHAVSRVLAAGVDVLFSDADVVWCADAAREVSALVYNSSWPAFGARVPALVMQTAWPRSLLNSGFYYARSTPRVVDLFAAMLAHDSDAENDQVIFNRVMCKRQFGGETVSNASHFSPLAPHRVMPSMCRWAGSVEARLLPAARFPTGGEIFNGDKLFHHPRTFIRALCERGSVAVLHNNCILAAKKKARFVVKGIWYVDAHDRCMKEPAPMTLAARKVCGGAKCGDEGLVRKKPYR